MDLAQLEAHWVNPPLLQPWGKMGPLEGGRIRSSEQPALSVEMMLRTWGQCEHVWPCPHASLIPLLIFSLYWKTICPNQRGWSVGSNVFGHIQPAPIWKPRAPTQRNDKLPCKSMTYSLVWRQTSFQEIMGTKYILRSQPINPVLDNIWKCKEAMKCLYFRS